MVFKKKADRTESDIARVKKPIRTAVDCFWGDYMVVSDNDSTIQAEVMEDWGLGELCDNRIPEPFGIMEVLYEAVPDVHSKRRLRSHSAGTAAEGGGGGSGGGSGQLGPVPSAPKVGGFAEDGEEVEDAVGGVDGGPAGLVWVPQVQPPVEAVAGKQRALLDEQFRIRASFDDSIASECSTLPGSWPTLASVDGTDT